MVQLDNIDSLKSWLKGCLMQSYGWENDCDSMIKYVVALLKKDLDEADLKKDCLEQLAVFFNASPEKFVDELFAAVKSKAYLQEYSSNAKPEGSDVDASKEHPVAFIVDKKPDITQVVRDRTRSRSKSPRRRSPRRYRSRSRSREAYRRKRSRSPIRSRRRYSRSRSPIRRSPPRDLRDSLTRKTNPATGRQRCRDFDEQGFCVRGEFCEYDHGSDPVILDSSDTYNPIRAPILSTARPAPTTTEYNPLLPAAEYDPLEHSNNRPYGWNYSATSAHSPNQPSTMPRELVVVPRNVTPILRASTHTPSENFNRNRYQRGTELEVRKIPSQQNNIATLNEFFSKFGTVTNIQVNFQGYAENALVKFSKHQEALAAYRSTDAVLGNRFIRLFWYHGNQGGNSEPNVANHGNRSETTPSSVPAKGEPPKKIAKPNPEMLKKDNQAEKSKQLSTQKQQLVDKYTKEHSKLVALLSKSQDDAQKEELQRMIKEVSKLIESLQGPATPAKPVEQSTEIMTEKQLLDAELDLYRQIQEGHSADSKELVAKVAQLKKRARSMGLIDGTHTWHGKMAHKGLLLPTKTVRAPKPPLGQLQLDKRPKVIQVIAGEIELPLLCMHFGRLSKLVNVQQEVNDEGAKVYVFTFASRKDAEVAVNRGSIFKGVALKWTWIEQTAKDVKDEEVKRDNTGATLNEHESKDDALNVKVDAKDVLAGDDEDEDDKSRSWRH